MQKKILATPQTQGTLIESPGTATAILTGDGRFVVLSPALAEEIARRILDGRRQTGSLAHTEHGLVQ